MAGVYTFTRILQYVGSREEIDLAMERRSVKESAPADWNGGRLRIYEAVVSRPPLPVGFEWVRDWLKAEQLRAARDIVPEYGWEKEGYTAALDALEAFLDELKDD